MASFNDVAKLYVATFNRAPDAAGLNYWANSSGLSIEEIAQSFFDQPETQNLYPSGVPNDSFVNSVYNNLFNRAAEQAGLDYWVAELDSGRVSKQNFILAVINGAQNTALGQDATILTNKQTVGLSFVLHGLDDVTLAHSVMSGIDASASSVESAVTSIDQTAPISTISTVTGDIEGTALRGDVYDISQDGRYIVFWGLAAEYYTSGSDYSFYGGLFRKDMFTGETEVVSTDAVGTAANGNAMLPSMSADGRYIVFQGNANNLVYNDSNNVNDIFLKDMDTGSLQIISRSGTGVQGNDDSNAPSISADGRYVVFMSAATNLVDGDINGVSDTFVKDIQTGEIARISLSQTGSQGNGASYGGAISADGRYVAFVSDASNLVAGDTNGVSDIFLWDRQTGNISMVSTATDGQEGMGGREGCSSSSISSDGRYVAFISDATNFTTGLSGGENRTMSTYDVYVKDTLTGTLTVVSTTAQGTLTTYGGYDPSISDDGTYVTFTSSSPYVYDDTNFYKDIYIKNILTGAIERVSTSAGGTQGNGESEGSAISGDGRFIAFNSWASNFANSDTNGYSDGFRVANPMSDASALSTAGISPMHVADFSVA